MDAINSLLRVFVRGYNAAFCMIPAGQRLAMLAFFTAIGMLWVFKRTSSPARIRDVKRLVQAHLLEMRLFRDEPSVVWKAQGSLLASNARYIGLMLIPALWLAAPFTLLMIHLDSQYGWMPLPPWQDAIVTLKMKGPIDPDTPVPEMMTPKSIKVSAPAVRVAGSQEISWRIRPMGPMSGKLQFSVNGEVIEKRIDAGDTPHFVSSRRTASWWDSIWNPSEPRIQSASVDWIEIRYPAADMEILGVRMHWMVWFTLFSMGIALLLKNRFGVAF